MSEYGLGLLIWAVLGAVLGAIVGPRNGWTPLAGAGLGAFFGLIGVLILLLVKGGGPTSADRERSRQWEEWNRWQSWQQHQGQWASLQASLPPGWRVDQAYYDAGLKQWVVRAYDGAERPIHGVRQRQSTGMGLSESDAWTALTQALQRDWGWRR